MVPVLAERFAPDVLVTQLGIDTHYQDPLTHLALTTHGYAALVRSLQPSRPTAARQSASFLIAGSRSMR